MRVAPAACISSSSVGTTVLVALASVIVYLYSKMPASDVTFIGPASEETGGFDGKVRFLTYNLFIRPPAIQSNGEDYKDERLNDFVPFVKNYDIMCLQELFALGSDRRQRFIQLAAKEGLRYSVFVPAKIWGIYPPRVLDGGVSIVSRFPIVDTDYYLYSDATLSTADAWCAKGVLWAKVKLPGEKGHLHVFSTHMQAHDHPDGRYSSVRLKQSAQIRSFVAAKTKDGYPAILAGDFNVNGRKARDNGMEDSDEFKAIWGVLTKADAGGKSWQDVLRDFHNREHVITGGDEFIVNRGIKPRSEEQCSKRLDYVLLDTGSGAMPIKAESCRLNAFETPEDKPYVRLSDHLAIEAVFAV